MQIRWHGRWAETSLASPARLGLGNFRRLQGIHALTYRFTSVSIVSHHQRLLTMLCVVSIPMCPASAIPWWHRKTRRMRERGTTGRRRLARRFGPAVRHRKPFRGPFFTTSKNFDVFSSPASNLDNFDLQNWSLLWQSMKCVGDRLRGSRNDSVSSGRLQ